MTPPDEFRGYDAWLTTTPDDNAPRRRPFVDGVPPGRAGLERMRAERDAKQHPNRAHGAQES